MHAQHIDRQQYSIVYYRMLVNSNCMFVPAGSGTAPETTMHLALTCPPMKHDSAQGLA